MKAFYSSRFQQSGTGPVAPATATQAAMETPSPQVKDNRIYSTITEPSDQGPDLRLMRTQDVASLFGVTPRTLYNWRKKHCLTVSRITGRSLFYRREAIEKCLNESEV